MREDDRVATVGGGDGVAQRTRTVVRVVQDGQGAGHGAILEDFKVRQEAWWPVLS
jgi:hypothetical protein